MLEQNDKGIASLGEGGGAPEFHHPTGGFDRWTEQISGDRIFLIDKPSRKKGRRANKK